MGRGDGRWCGWTAEVRVTDEDPGLTIPRSLSQSVAQGAGQAVCPSVWTPRGGKNRGEGWSF